MIAGFPPDLARSSSTLRRPPAAPVRQAIEDTLHEQPLPATEFSWRRYDQVRIDGQRVDAAHTPRRGATLAA